MHLNFNLFCISDMSGGRMDFRKTAGLEQEGDFGINSGYNLWRQPNISSTSQPLIDSTGELDLTVHQTQLRFYCA